jgi:hypothetical protein
MKKNRAIPFEVVGAADVLLGGLVIFQAFAFHRFRQESKNFGRGSIVRPGETGVATPHPW